MVLPELDFVSREYVAEVLRAPAGTAGNLVDRALALSHVSVRASSKGEDASADGRPASRDGLSIRLGRVSWDRRLGRYSDVPRPAPNGRFFYDVIFAHRGELLMVAVPYSALAMAFFPRLDRGLVGTGAVYERLDITELVVRLGAMGRLAVEAGGDPRNGAAKRRAAEEDSEGEDMCVVLTRCHLAYERWGSRDRDIMSVSLRGRDLGQSKEYRHLIEPVLNPPEDGRVTPTTLGISLEVDEIRKGSITSDRFGNFRFWVSPTLVGVGRSMGVLRALGRLEGIVAASSNVPILQARHEDGGDEE